MRPGGLALVVLVAVGSAAPARANEPPPWARGVTDAQKAAAQVLLEAGNSLFLVHDYVAALDKYRQAIARWDHPAIRFNIVRCLVQLDRALEADDELRRALAYGAAPLEDSVYNEALAYQKLLANQIGHVAVRCVQPGVEVSLDGQHVASCPAAVDTRVAPGAHEIVGIRDGYAAKAVSVVVIGGKHETIDLTLTAIGGSGVVVHRWASWKPWLVLGAGAGVAGLGALIDLRAARDMTSYDHAFAAACADVGCGPGHPVPASVASQERSAQHEGDAGVALITRGARGRGHRRRAALREPRAHGVPGRAPRRHAARRRRHGHVDRPFLDQGWQSGSLPSTSPSQSSSTPSLQSVSCGRQFHGRVRTSWRIVGSAGLS